TAALCSQLKTPRYDTSDCHAAPLTTPTDTRNPTTTATKAPPRHPMHLHQRINRQQPLGLTFWGQWLSAMAVLVALLYLLADMKTGTFEQHNSVLAMLVVICSLPIYSAIHVYDRRVGYLAVVRRLTFAWVVLL